MHKTNPPLSAINQNQAAACGFFLSCKSLNSKQLLGFLVSSDVRRFHDVSALTCIASCITVVLSSTLDNLAMPPLTALEIRQEAARRTNKTRTLSDGNSLNLIIPASAANGNPRWVLRFAGNGKPSMRGLGRYPEVSLGLHKR